MPRTAAEYLNAASSSLGSSLPAEGSPAADSCGVRPAASFAACVTSWLGVDDSGLAAASVPDPEAGAVEVGALGWDCCSAVLPSERDATSSSTKPNLREIFFTCDRRRLTL